jgi:hypothetical protein
MARRRFQNGNAHFGEGVYPRVLFVRVANTGLISSRVKRVSEERKSAIEKKGLK